MIDLSTLKSLTIPEGAVKSIEDATGRVIWTVPESYIQFTINDQGIVKTFKADPGMTWTEWCNSSYNTDGYSIVDNRVGRANGVFYITNEKPGNVIVDGGSYMTVMDF